MKYLILLILVLQGCFAGQSLKDMSHSIDHEWDRAQINNLKDDVTKLKERMTALEHNVIIMEPYPSGVIHEEDYKKEIK